MQGFHPMAVQHSSTHQDTSGKLACDGSCMAPFLTTSAQGPLFGLMGTARTAEPQVVAAIPSIFRPCLLPIGMMHDARSTKLGWELPC